ncbi:MAG: hypothetical protein PF484_01825 [Bacteroidales bacterium]|jgi:hypothetical protein|nr:hypothetical protein [Bacteroidales bacterium]
MKIIRLFAVSFLIFLLAACQRDKKCPEFNPDDLSHIAYNKFDTLIFTNQKNDTFSIYLQNFNLSSSFEQHCNFNEFVCPCLNYVELIAQNSPMGFSYVFLKMEQSDASDMRYFKYRVLDFDFEIDFDNEVNYIDDFPYLELLENFTINNTVYYNVVIYSNLDNSSSEISNVYLNKTNGILQIETKENIVWQRNN